MGKTFHWVCVLDERGEAKSDSKDARVIADQLRLRRGSLHEVCPKNETTTEMRLLVAHRRDLLQDQTRRAARLREVLLGMFPGLEAALNLKWEGAPLLAVIALARRRVGVLWAMLRDGQTYSERPAQAA